MHKLTNFSHHNLLKLFEMVTFGENFLRFLSSLQSLLFQIFSTNTTKVKNGHFWTILNKFRAFLIFKDLNEKFFGKNLYVNVKCSPKYLETINILSFQKKFELLIKSPFLYNEH